MGRASWSWENSVWTGTNNGLFKSTDGGATWRALANGLPQGFQHIEITISPSEPRRLYALVAGGGGGGAGGGGRGAGGGGGGGVFFRSDDGGETWTRPTTDNRAGGQRVSESNIVVYPNNPDWVLVTDIVTMRSLDGGRTWAPFKGAPGGEDYQGGWINPDNPDIILLFVDQGAVVTLERRRDVDHVVQPAHRGALSHRGRLQLPLPPLQRPAGQRVGVRRLARQLRRAVDSRLAAGGRGRVRLCGAGSAEPALVYGGRSVTRFDYRTGQSSTVGPTGGRGGGPAGAAPLAFRQVRTHPVVFSEADKRMLLFGNNYLWKTIDGGITWTRISDDLTRKTHEAPRSIGTYTTQAQPQLDTNGARVIYTIGPSPIDANRLWIGTDDGVIQTTADGGLHWTDVTPPQVGSYWKVFMIDAGRFDARTAYAAVNTLRIDDMQPHIYRTLDAGKTWTEIVNGMAGAGPANAVREDPKKRGLLYASTEKGVYVSFDNGDHWQSLRLNLPPSSVRDLIVKDDDVAVATHGRGFWILDDVTPLRQIDTGTAARDVVLFKPAVAWRVRWNLSSDMPWPKDEPTLPNPPEGAPINYYLRGAATGPVTLEILTPDGKLVRRYSSADALAPVPGPETATVPIHWYRPPQPLPSGAGAHRFQWDLRYQPLGEGGGRGGPSIAAIAYNSAPAPSTPLVVPGTYTVKLTANGQTQTQTMTVKQDPRVKTPRSRCSRCIRSSRPRTSARRTRARHKSAREAFASRSPTAPRRRTGRRRRRSRLLTRRSRRLPAPPPQVEAVVAALPAVVAAAGHLPPQGRRRWPARPARSAASSIRSARPTCRRRRIRSPRSRAPAPSPRA